MGGAIRRSNTTTIAVFFTYSVKRSWTLNVHFSIKIVLRPVDPSQRHCQVGNLAGAAPLSNDNEGVLR